jgi:colanic acid/amylovoran biosynthesis glycosyltransferase
MRVLVFTDEYDFGYFTFVYNEIKKLEEANVDVFVVCERIGKLRNTDVNYSCIPLTEYKLFRNFFLALSKRRMFFITRFYRYYTLRKKIIDKFKPDLIHVHFGDTATRLFFPLKKSLKNKPYVVSFHGFDASSHLNRPDYLESLRALMVQPEFYGICVSQHLKNNLTDKDLRINRRNSSLLYYGIDESMFRRIRYQDNDVKIFLQISSFHEKKGHIYTLRAFKKFSERNKGKARLIIGGDGPLRDDILSTCRELELCNEVEFPGWISRERAVELLNQANYFVHHSITASNGDQEGMPNAIIEAMAMELPVISTFHSGIPELIEDGVNGYLVQEKDIETYALRMEQILDWTYSSVNREKIQKQFSLKVHTESLISIYRNLVPEKSN